MGEDSLKAYLTDAEAKKIREVLKKCGGNVTQAAARMEITEQSLYKKCKRFGIKPSAYRPENLAAAMEVLGRE